MSKTVQELREERIHVLGVLISNLKQLRDGIEDQIEKFEEEQRGHIELQGRTLEFPEFKPTPMGGQVGSV